MKKIIILVFLIGLSYSLQACEKYKSEIMSVGNQTSKYISAWKNGELTNDKVNEIISKIDKVEEYVQNSTPCEDGNGKFIKRQTRIIYWLPTITSSMRTKQAIDTIVRSFKNDTE
ncbi:MAG: hypothetical protein PHH41_11065 [Sulfurimonas sp.]|nr:hypothetical protein [Sulfurimonas sp.]